MAYCTRADYYYIVVELFLVLLFIRVCSTSTFFLLRILSDLSLLLNKKCLIE